MLFETNSQFDIREQSPLALAFVGDGVFELLVRQRAVETTRLPLNKLHAMAVGYVSAHHQAAGLRAIEPMLTEQEAGVVRRGRNANKVSVSKHATREEYCASTALESLFGWLYLQNRQERILELFEVIWQTLAEAYDAKKAE
jgi:ribonuclease-3 family protein